MRHQAKYLDDTLDGWGGGAKTSSNWSKKAKCVACRACRSDWGVIQGSPLDLNKTGVLEANREVLDFSVRNQSENCATGTGRGKFDALA